ncbi:MAG: thioredoxin family protein [Vampirovibrionales bacterium]|nr:thioredoxin family protein [Vampirovibrionales bacterium]
MFKKSFLLIAGLIALVAGLSFSGNLFALKQLPSSYDSGLTLDKALEDKSTPVLVEFYTDTCQTCKIVTPMVHEAVTPMGEKLRLVMVDADDPANAGFVNLFGIDEVPTLVLFDFGRMKKTPLPLSELGSVNAIRQTVTNALNKTQPLNPDGQPAPALSPEPESRQPEPKLAS